MQGNSALRVDRQPVRHGLGPGLWIGLNVLMIIAESALASYFYQKRRYMMLGTISTITIA